MSATDDWLAALLKQPAADVADLEPVTTAEATRRLALLGVPGADHTGVLATLPSPNRTPDLWEALQRCHQVLYAADPIPSRKVDWPNAPAELGEAGRYFYVHLFLLALPSLLALHSGLNIPFDVTAATVQDLGAKVVSYRKYYDTGGFDRQGWLVRHFRGTLFRLGRLQFDRAVLTIDEYQAESDDGPKDGTPVLEVHIPGDGPMTPEACDESFRRARPFFTAHFPDESYEYGTCRSWLLDPQLADFLPESSNIVRFQRLWSLFGPTPDCDSDVLEFVHHLPPGTGDLATLPQDTTLQRAIVSHLQSGGHWRQGCGWLALP
ncbi:acyltransferase domain-containing protein [Lentzea sp. NPDC092896]|uniref:acyltransferase domain-containing protein n=1 Tax=Lentzea sp. NPDC092896 TaxID=3364127 RepID=UPI00382BA2E3